MPKRDPLHNLQTRNQVLLERLKEGYSRNMVKTLTTALAKSEKHLRGLDVSRLDEIPFKEFKAGIDALKAAEISMMFEGITRQVEDWALLSEQQILAELEVLQSLTTKVHLKPVNTAKAFKDVLAAPMGVNGELLEPFVKNWASGAINKANNLFMKGWQEGATVQDMVRGLRGSRAGRFKDGIVEATSREAKTVVRTATQHIAVASRMELYHANGDLIKRYRYIATLDTRTSTRCRDLDKEVFELGKGPLPPQHPACRSSTVPELPAVFDIFNEGATRASIDGPVDADLDYYGWLKGQDAGFQDTALGPARGKLFRDGGLTTEDFKRLQLNTNFEPMTLKEMKAVAPAAFKNAGLLPDE